MNTFGNWQDHSAEDELADLKREFREPRKPRGCSDRMCGADDCPTCHPEYEPEKEEEEE